MENKQKLLEYLKSHDLIIIATADGKPAAATVYYGVDNDFKIFIITPPSTEHGTNIKKNKQIACVVVDTTQKQFQTEKKVGVQIYGKCEQVIEETEMKYALQIWSKGKEEVVEKYLKNIKGNIWQSRPFIITPERIKWFNEELYGPEGTETFTF